MGRWDLYSELDVNSISFVFNYFGLSNESVVAESSGLDSNRVRLSQGNAIFGMKRLSRDEKNEIRFGARYLQTEVEKTATFHMSLRDLQSVIERISTKSGR